MSEEIKVHPIKSFKDYGLAKRSFEELTKKLARYSWIWNWKMKKHLNWRVKL